MAAAEAMAAGKFCSGELLFRATYPDGAAQRVLPEALREWLWNSLVCGDHHATLLVRRARPRSLFAQTCDCWKRACSALLQAAAQGCAAPIERAARGRARRFA